MKANRIFLGTLFVAALIASGCRTSPVYNVSDAPVIVSSGKPTSVQVEKAITQAGSSLGWNMKDEGPGHVVGTLFIRSHVAKVDIFYDQDKYSIKYKDSENLKYDGTEIHSNYNGWVQNLDRAIKVQLDAL